MKHIKEMKLFNDFGKKSPTSSRRLSGGSMSPELKTLIEIDVLFKHYTLLPIAFGEVNLQKDENWEQTLRSRVNQCVIKRKMTISLGSVLQLEG